MEALPLVVIFVLFIVFAVMRGRNKRPPRIDDYDQHYNENDGQ